MVITLSSTQLCHNNVVVNLWKCTKEVTICKHFIIYLKLTYTIHCCVVTASDHVTASMHWHKQLHDVIRTHYADNSTNCALSLIEEWQFRIYRHKSYMLLAVSVSSAPIALRSSLPDIIAVSKIGSQRKRYTITLTLTGGTGTESTKFGSWVVLTALHVWHTSAISMMLISWKSPQSGAKFRHCNIEM